MQPFDVLMLVFVLCGCFYWIHSIATVLTHMLDLEDSIRHHGIQTRCNQME